MSGKQSTAMPQLRVNITDVTLKRLNELAALHGYEGHMKRGALVDLLVYEVYRDTCLDMSTRGTKKRAARILTANGKWLHPVSWRSVVKVVVGSPVLIYLQDIGEPYRVSEEDWNKG